MNCSGSPSPNLTRAAAVTSSREEPSTIPVWSVVNGLITAEDTGATRTSRFGSAVEVSMPPIITNRPVVVPSGRPSVKSPLAAVVAWGWVAGSYDTTAPARLVPLAS